MVVGDRVRRRVALLCGRAAVGLDSQDGARHSAAILAAMGAGGGHGAVPHTSHDAASRLQAPGPMTGARAVGKEDPKV